MSCSKAGVKSYELLVEGYHTPLSADAIADLYRAGRLRKSDPCRDAGSQNWRTVDELFPLLKYDSSRAPSHSVATANSSILDRSDMAGAPPAATTSALKAGWICFGLGLAISWCFPLGNAFFSVALITAVVAMCTHQVNRGLILLLSSFLGIALSVLIFFALAVGAICAVAAPAIKQTDADLLRLRAAQNRANGQMQSAVLPPNSPSLFASDPLPTVTALAHFSNRNVLTRQPPVIAPADPNAAAMRDRARQAEAIRKAEQQRDEINAKEQRIEQLQKSIEWNEDQIRRIRSHGGNERIFVEQRDQLVKQKWDLQQ